MTYTGPKFTTGPAAQRDNRLMLALLRTIRDSEGQRDWMPGELGNAYGFRNLGTAEWRGYVERRVSPQGRQTDFIDITPAGRAILAEAGE